MLTVRNLSYEYPGKAALDDVSFEVEQGSITALVGPNGAGKSTLMRCLAGLDKPFSGEIYFNDINVIEDAKKAHAEIGYLADFFGVYEELSVAQSLWFAASIRGLEGDEVNERVKEIARLLDLTDKLNEPAKNLSRGMRQRLGIAQAVIHLPKLLILDEPASGLDPEARINLSKLMLDLKKTGMTIIVSSHILSELEDYSTEMIVIRDARIIGKESLGKKTAKRSRLIEVKYSGKLSEKALADLKISERGDKSFVIEFSGSEDEQAALLAALIKKKIAVSEFALREKTMQDHYMNLAQTHDQRSKK